MFSATVWNLILFTFAVYNFRHLDNKLLNMFPEIIHEPITVGLSVKFKNLKNFNTQHVRIMCLERMMHLPIRSIVLYISELKTLLAFLTSNFRRVLNVVCFLLGNSQTPGNYPEESIQHTFNTLVCFLFLKIGCCHMHIIMPSFGGMGEEPYL